MNSFCLLFEDHRKYFRSQILEEGFCRKFSFSEISHGLFSTKSYNSRKWKFGRNDLKLSLEPAGGCVRKTALLTLLPAWNSKIKISGKIPSRWKCWPEDKPTLETICWWNRGDFESNVIHRTGRTNRHSPTMVCFPPFTSGVDWVLYLF